MTPFRGGTSVRVLSVVVVLCDGLKKSIAQGLKALGDELVDIVVVLVYPLRRISVPSSDEHSDRSRSSRLSESA